MTMRRRCVAGLFCDLAGRVRARQGRAGRGLGWIEEETRAFEFFRDMGGRDLGMRAHTKPHQLDQAFWSKARGFD